MNTTISSETEKGERDRRESFRINDRIAMRVQPLSKAEFRQVRAHLLNAQQRQRLLNSILARSGSQRGMLRSIRDYDPAVANYLQSLEERLDALAQLMVLEQNKAPNVPTHDVDISGNGLRFQHPQALPERSYVSLDLQLFPARTCLNVLGQVVRSKKLQRVAKDAGRFAVAVTFCDIHEDDRELLIRHIHSLELDYARRGALRI